MSEQVVIDREAPLWAQRLQTDINALMQRLNQKLSGTTATTSDLATQIASLGTEIDAVEADVADLQADIAALPTLMSYDSGEQTITNGGSLTLAHGLGATPRIMFPTFICKTAQLNYVADDEVFIDLSGRDATLANSRGMSFWNDATNINVRYGASAPAILNKTTGSPAALTPANWRLIVRAYRWA
jgi:hypothetical protein